LHPQPRGFALAEVFDPLAAEFRVLAEERGIRLDVVGSRAWVHTDPQLLRRVLQNFLSNALRYAERGRVLLGARRRGDRLRLEVWDTGPGIAPEEQRVIFDEFRRGSTAGGQGLGLGLSIAQRMAGLLGTPLHLRSWPGRGSVFDLEVLRVAPSLQDATTVVAAQPLPNGRALVVDNEPAALSALSALLSSWGWQVHAARTIEQAREAPWPADLHIFDYHLDGGCTGIDVWQALGEAATGTPTIILTADRDGELRQRLLERGVGVLYKPLKPLALRQVLQRVATAQQV
jgi:CheY-like chemotaxis protein